MNIGGNTNDTFYRYKMTPLSISQEGKNQNTRTMIKNFVLICGELKRNPTDIEKFIGYKLNLRVKIDKKELMVHGDHTVVMLQSIISEYIKDYVLCGSCGNPETNICNNKLVNTLVCCACGSTTEVNNSSKLNKRYNEYLIKSYKPTKTSDAPSQSQSQSQSKQTKDSSPDPTVVKEKEEE